MTRRTAVPSGPKPASPVGNSLSDLGARYGCGPVRFSGADDALYERRLVFDHVVDPGNAWPREKFEAVAAAIRDLLSQRWVRTQQEYDRGNPKQVYYLSMEFLIGRSLANKITNLMLSPLVDAAARDTGLRLAELLEREPADRRQWGRKAILNVARSGKFSSDRTIAEYAESIWGAAPCPVGETRPPGMGGK